jgi:hypothetical protein
MDWMSFALGFFVNFAVIGVVAVIVAAKNSGEEVVDAPSKKEDVCFAWAGACRVCGAPCPEGVLPSFCFTGRRGRAGCF